MEALFDIEETVENNLAIEIVNAKSSDSNTSNHHDLSLKLPSLQLPEQQKTQSIPDNETEEWAVSFEGKIEQALHVEPDNETEKRKPCIYRVPECPSEHKAAFIPQVVSLGPYHHHNNRRLRDMESHKCHSLHQILKRNNQNVKLYLDSISKVEVKARSCYKESASHISMSPHEFVEMMVLDGCFMLEIFRGAVHGFDKLGYPENDPIFAFRKNMYSIRQDMVMLENQIPLFILDRLLALQVGVDPLVTERTQAAQLALKFLDPFLLTDESLWNRNRRKSIKYVDTDTVTTLNGLHCLDVLRRKPPNWKNCHRSPAERQTLDLSVMHRQQLVRCATELRAAGVKFKKRKTTDRFWDVKFKNGTLRIPRLVVNEGTKSLLLNLKAYEQCHHNCGNEVTSYLILMDNLINSEADVSYLVRRKILEHWLGSNVEVAEFFNCLCRQAVFDLQDSYICEMSAEVNEFCDKKRNEWLAIFRQNHLRNPWTIISLFAGLILLLLTSLQTFYSVYGYYKPSR